MSEGVPSDVGSPEGALHASVQMPSCHADSDIFPYLPFGGIECNPEVLEQARLSTYTGLNDYDSLFEAKHGRGVVDNIPMTGGRTLVVPPIGMPSTTASEDVVDNIMVGPRPKHTPDNGQLLPDKRGHASIGEVPSMTGPRVTSPVNNQHILGEGAAIFTDMRETMLTALDQQMALLSEVQKLEDSLTSNVLTPRQPSSIGNIERSKMSP